LFSVQPKPTDHYQNNLVEIPILKRSVDFLILGILEEKTMLGKLLEKVFDHNIGLKKQNTLTMT